MRTLLKSIQFKISIRKKSLQLKITFETMMRGIMHNAIQLAALCLLFNACTHKTSSNQKSVFYYNESNGISSLDPAFSRDIEVMWATNQLFDGLVELDDSMRIIPCIAKSWSINDDGKRYTFHLRDSVFFHPSPLFSDSSGRKVVANDFVYSFQRLMNKSLASPAVWIFKYVDFENHNGFEAVDDSTLQIYLTQPFQPFLGILAMQYCNVVPHEVVEHYGPDFRSHPIGTGPFRFAFWYEQVALVFHKFDKYWMQDDTGNRLPYLDAVKIDFIRDMTVEYQGLLQGTYDFMSGIHPAFKDELLTPDGDLQSRFNSQIHFQRSPFIKTDYMGFQMDEKFEITRNSPLMIKQVRQALSMAINKNELVRYLKNNTVFAADQGFLPPALNPFCKSSFYPYNPERARILLDSAGFKNQNIEVTITASPDYTDLLEFIQHAWEKLGVRTKIQILQGPALREQSANGQLAIFRKSWLADYADAENFLTVFYTPSFCPAGPNYTHFSNSTYDSLYVLSQSLTDINARNEAYAKMNEILMESAPIIPLYYDQVSHFIRNCIQDFPTNPVNMLDLRRVKKMSDEN
jgi:oligopeptide transport system substrate-binding protein